MELIKAAEKKDLEEISSLAREIWPEVYAGVIPPEQIAFLLTRYFEIDNMEQYRRKGYEYCLVEEDGKEAGFISFQEREKETYLDKLYLKKEYRHRGLGKMIFAWLLQTYEKDIQLNVNQGNARAVNVYLRSGFVIEREETIPLPGGLINKDYIMRKKR